MNRPTPKLAAAHPIASLTLYSAVVLAVRLRILKFRRQYQPRRLGAKLRHRHSLIELISLHRLSLHEVGSWTFCTLNHGVQPGLILFTPWHSRAEPVSCLGH